MTEKKIRRIVLPVMIAAAAAVILVLSWLAGAPRAGAYIDYDAALSAACAHAGVSVNEAADCKIELDREDGATVYEVEFCVGDSTYEYEIDCYTGAVRSHHLEAHSDHYHGATAAPAPVPGTTAVPVEIPDDLIGEDAALSAACAHAGVPLSEATGCRVELDRENGALVYEVEFHHGDLEYDYEIYCLTGEVRKHQCEDNSVGHHGTTTAPASPAPSQTPAVAPASLIGEEAARNYALTHAGCSAGDASYINCYLDYDDGRAECYEVEFCVGNSTYEYEIDCYTGAVLKHECETVSAGHHGDSHHGDSHHGTTAAPSPSPSPSAPALIGREAAKAAAFTHAGVAAGDAWDVKVEQDMENGVTVYEVEFKAGGMEYEYEIDAYTGAVLKYEIERDD